MKAAWASVSLRDRPVEGKLSENPMISVTGKNLRVIAPNVKMPDGSSFVCKTF